MARHVGHRFAPAHGAGDLLDQAAADLVGIGNRRGQHVRHQRRSRRPDGDAGQRLGHRIGRGLHQPAMERRRHRQQHGALGALGLGDLERALDRGLVAGHHDLPAAIVIGGLADLALRGLVGNGDRGLVVEPEQRRHRAGADRHRLLHGKAAGAQQARGIADAEAAGGGERGIFAERMAGHEGGVPPDREAGLGLQHPQGGERDRHQGRLGIFGELQGLGRAVPDDGGQLLAERRIDLVENRARRRKGLRQGLAHADRLGTLPRKCECCRHRRSLNVPNPLKLGRKTPRGTVMSSQRRFRAPFGAKGGPVSLAIRPKILINRAIRGSRPGAERTVSAISPFRRF